MMVAMKRMRKHGESRGAAGPYPCERSSAAAWLAGPALAAMLIGGSLASAPVYGKDEIDYIAMMQSYLSLVNDAVDTVGRPEAAAMLGIEGIFEIYEQRRDAPGAVAHYERLLEAHGENRTVRTLLRLKLRDIYKETGQSDKALQQLDLIIAENAAATSLPASD